MALCHILVGFNVLDLPSASIHHKTCRLERRVDVESGEPAWEV